MDNFNNGNNGMPEDVTTMVDNIVNQDPAADLANQMNVDLGMTGETPVEASAEAPAEGGLKLAQGTTVNPAPQFGQPMGDMNNIPNFGQQPQFGQSADVSQQPQFGQPMGGFPQQPQFGQPQMGVAPQQPYGQPMGAAPQQPQFGQPMMGMAMGQTQFNQQPYGQPMGMSQPPQGGKPPKKPKKPLSKGAIGGIIGGGVALIALIVCAIIFLPKLFPSDKEVVVDAFEATFGIEVDAETEDILGAEEIADKFATTGGVRDISISITEPSLDETVTVRAVESIDVANKLANSTWTISMNDNNFLNANLVIDETNTYFQVPEIINGYFSLPNENIFQALESSELGQAMGLEGMPEFNMADMYFNIATSNTATEINGEYVAIVEQLWDSITYEKQGKAKVDVNGSTVTAKEYFVTVPEDSIKEAIESLWDAAVAELAANPEYLAQTGMDAATLESTMGSYGSMITSLIQGDLVIKVYVKDDKIVKLVCADDVTIYGTPLEYDFYLDIDDKKMSGVFDISVMDESVGFKFDVDNLDTNPSGKVTVYAAGEIIDVNFKLTDNSSDTKTACNLYFDVVYGGTTYVTCDTTVNADNSSNTFDGDMVLDIMDEGEIGFEFAGAIKDINKGVGYTLELSKCDVLANGEKMLGMTMAVKVDTSTHEASGIDSSLPVYDVVSMTESDFETIVAENADLVQAWMDANPDLFSGYEEPAEPTEPEEPEEDDMILEAGGKSVEILGTIDGFTLDYVSDWYISYSTEEWSYIEYSIYEGWTPEEVVDFIYIPEEGVITQEIGQTMELDGETIYYSYVQDNEYGSILSSYVFAKEISEGVVLSASIGIYDEDEPVEYTKETLVETLSTKYYQIIE